MSQATRSAATDIEAAEVLSATSLRRDSDAYFACTVKGKHSKRDRRSHKQRFRGGADHDSYDESDYAELPLDEFDEPHVAPPPPRKVGFLRSIISQAAPPPEPEPEPEPELEPDSEPEGHPVCRYLKMILLAAIWCIMALLLALNKEEDHELKLLTVPANSSIEYVLDSISVSGPLGFGITGPFILDQDLHTSRRAYNPMLYIMMQRFYYDKDKQVILKMNISEPLSLTVVPSDNFDHVRLDTRTHVFVLDDEPSQVSDISKLVLVMTIDASTLITVKVWFDTSPLNEDAGIILGSMVLIFLYILIVWEVINRTFASILAATLAVAVLSLLRARPTLTAIMDWIDIETLMLLFSMMILVGILSDSGVFDYLAVYAYKISRGHVWPLVNTLCIFTATLSAFLDSVTMMLLISPIVIRLCEVMLVDPVLVLMFLVFFANVGAASTPVGDPPNIIITTNSFIVDHGVNFGNFMLHTLPCVLLALLQSYIQLRLMFPRLEMFHEDDIEMSEQKKLEREVHLWKRAAAAISPYSKDEGIVRDTLLKKANRMKRKIKQTIGGPKKPAPNYEETLEQLSAAYGIRNKALLIKSVISFFFVLSLFLLHSVHGLHHLSLGWAALMGSVLLLILADVQDMEAILSRVEWSTLIFFAALFILMEALSQMGVIDLVGNWVIYAVLQVEEEFRLAIAILILLWVSSIMSAFLDNIPVTTMMVRIVISLAQNKDLNLPLHPLVWSLALGACFGGNGTLIAASANVVCAGVATQHGYNLSFVRFFRAGFPLMLGNVIVTTVYLLVCHVLFHWHTPPHQTP